MKALKIDYDFYYFPSENNTMETFIHFLQQNYNSFIPLTHLIEEHCREPYLIKENVETTYLNVAQISEINEVEITVLSQEEYEQRLKEVVASKCVRCQHYIDDGGDEIKSNRDKISLDGECIFFEEAED